MEIAQAIYCISNKINQRSYVGRTTDVERRVNTHFSRLRHGKHFSKKFQADFNLFGEKSFSSEVLIDNLYPDEATPFEYAWIYHLDSVDNGYNKILVIDANVKTAYEIILMTGQIEAAKMTQGRLKGENRVLQGMMEALKEQFTQVKEDLRLAQIELTEIRAAQ